MASLRSSKGDDETSLLPNTRLEKPIQAVAKVITAPTDRLDLDYGDNHFFFQPDTKFAFLISRSVVI